MARPGRVSSSAQELSFDAMIEGLENADQEKFEEGIALFEEASLVGNEAETAMLSIRSKCIGQ